jgi:lantibiotic transport system permease protein
MELLKTTQSELFKMKKTKAFWLALLAPVAVVGLESLVLLFMDLGEQENIWNFHIENTLLLWVLLTLPMYLSLGSAVITNIETSSGGWKQLFSAPVSRASVYLAKVLAGLLFLTLSSAVIGVLTIGTGYLVGALKGYESVLETIPDIGRMFSLLGLILLSSTLILSIQLWLASRFKSFILPAGLGVVGIISNFILTNSVKFARFSPWMFPVSIISNESGKVASDSLYYVSTPTYLTVSIVGALIITLFALQDLRKKDVL